MALTMWYFYVSSVYRHDNFPSEWLMQHQQFNILRKCYVFLLKLLKTLIVAHLSGCARGLNDVCGSFV